MSARLAAAAALVAAFAGCDLLSRAQNHTDMAATLLVAPLPPPATAGERPVVAQVFLGRHDGDLTSPPTSLTGITGAAVTVTWDGLAQPIALADQGSGNYGATWTTGTHAYAPGAVHTFTATVGGDTYWVKAAAAAAPTLTLTSGAAFTNWSDVPAPYAVHRTGNDVGVVAVFAGSYDPQNPAAAKTCTNLPLDASGLLALAFSDGDWTRSDFYLPKAALGESSASGTASPRFDAPCFVPHDNVYVVTLTALAKGDSSSNLSLFSTALVGAGAAEAVTVAHPNQ